MDIILEELYPPPPEPDPVVEEVRAGRIRGEKASVIGWAGCWREFGRILGDCFGGIFDVGIFDLYD